MYTVHDDFNDLTVSRHRTLRGAVEAQADFRRAVERANGRDSYIPTTILLNGAALSDTEHDEAGEIMMRLSRKRP